MCIRDRYNGATTRELDELSIRTAALLTAEEPEYSRLAARLLADTITKEVTGQEIHAFSQSILRGHEVGLINDRLLGFVQTNARKLNDALDASLDRRFDYFGLRTPVSYTHLDVYKRQDMSKSKKHPSSILPLSLIHI